MSQASSWKPRSPLRRDLNALVRKGRRRRDRVVVDEVSGRIARISERAWQSLVGGHADLRLWDQARALGWTCQRADHAAPRINPLYLQIPLGSIDPLATRLANHCGWLFAPAAVAAWCLLILVAAVLAMARAGDLRADFGTLAQFFAQANPIWLGAIFVGTKVIHELGHAVMCRRMGSRCGSLGVLVLCGMPCPYCDVTDIWRQGSTVRRLAVMLAGIYLELIVASIATFVWLFATDPAVRFHALNLMVVCGISTLLFNANPLMRYDGYYVLGDLAGSANLRYEARQAFHEVILSRIAGRGYGSPRQSDLRSMALTLYHGGSAVYRSIMLIAIAALFLSVADYFQLRRLGIAALGVVVVVLVVRTARGVGRLVSGKGPWQRVSCRRRGAVVLAFAVLAALMLFVPLPRRRAAVGVIDVADAQSVYLSHDGIIDRVEAEFGQRVAPGDPLVEVRDQSLAVQQTKLEGDFRLASLRRELSRRSTLDRTEIAQHWEILRAAEDAVRGQLEAVRIRQAATVVRAPIAGVVLPPDPTVPCRTGESLSLRRRSGTAGAAHQPWCRISAAGKIQAVVVLDARDRSEINVDAEVMIGLAGSTAAAYRSTVQSLSAISPETETVSRQAEYRVLCPLPDVDRQELLGRLGQECQAVFRLPSRSLAGDIGRWLRSWLDGELS